MPRPERTPPPPPKHMEGESDMSYQLRYEKWKDENRPPAPPPEPSYGVISYGGPFEIGLISALKWVWREILGIVKPFTLMINFLKDNAAVGGPTTPPPPPVRVDEDDNSDGKSKTRSDLIERLLERAMADRRSAHRSLAVPVWNDCGWVVEIGNDMVCSKKNVVIHSTTSIRLDGDTVWNPYQKIDINGAWSFYVIDDLKRIADEVDKRVDRAVRRERAKQRLVKMQASQRMRYLADKANDESLFDGWDEREVECDGSNSG